MRVSARLDSDVLEVVQPVAEVQRRPISNLVRNIVSDWAKTASVTTRRRHERSDRRRPAPWIFRFDTGAELGDAFDLIRVPVVLAAVVFAAVCALLEGNGAKSARRAAHALVEKNEIEVPCQALQYRASTLSSAVFTLSTRLGHRPEVQAPPRFRADLGLPQGPALRLAIDCFNPRGGSPPCQ